MSDDNKSKQKKITTPNFRVSFPNVFKPRSNFANQEPKYSVQMLFDKDADLKAMKGLAMEVAKARFGERNTWPKNLRWPFKDGDKKNLADHKGKIIVEARSKMKPGLVGRDMQEIIDPQDFYAGCWGRATVICYAYPKPGVQGITPGIAFGLQNLQKVKDDAAFSGKANPQDDFEALDELEETSTETEDEDDIAF